jgi:hypothetical protein
MYDLEDNKELSIVNGVVSLKDKKIELKGSLIIYKESQ